MHCISLVRSKFPSLETPVLIFKLIKRFQFYPDFGDCLRRLGDNVSAIDKDASTRLHQFADGAEEAEKDLHRSFFKQ